MGIMHRDVKPHNVMIDHENRKVTFAYFEFINHTLSIVLLRVHSASQQQQHLSSYSHKKVQKYASEMKRTEVKRSHIQNRLINTINHKH